LALSLLACKDEASVGKETCQGANTSCVAPERSELPPLLDATHVRTDALAELQMAEETTLDVPHDAADGGPLELVQLVGSDGTLWLFSVNQDRRAVHVHTLDGRSGAFTGEQVIDVPEDPEPLEGAADDVSGPLLFGFMRVVNGAPPAPIIEVTWIRDCSTANSPDTSCPIAAELLAFGSSIESPARRAALRWSGVDTQAATGKDGELWAVTSDSLRKYDSQNEVRQNLLAGPNFLTSSEGVSGIAALASGGLVAAAYSLEAPNQKIPELWRFDASGSATFRAYYSLPAEDGYNPAVIEDQRGRIVVLSTDQTGSLDLIRFASDSFEPEAHFYVMRDSYYTLYAESLSQDAAGALYVLTTTGTLSRPLPTLCKLPLEGDLRCYAVPELMSHQISAGEGGTVYTAGYSYADQDGGAHTPDQLTLRRFEVP
jgi:hypothetical protein